MDDDSRTQITADTDIELSITDPSALPHDAVSQPGGDNDSQPDSETLSVNGLTAARVSLLPTVRPKRRVCAMKRFWCGCCGITLILFVTLWFVAFLPIARSMVIEKAKTTHVNVLGASVRIDETNPVIYTESLEIMIPKSAWDIGPLFGWIYYTAEIPPVNATMYVHLRNDTVIESGRFESASSMKLSSWHDLETNVTGVLHPNMSVIEELLLATIRDPVLRTHITTTVDVTAKVLGFIPITIPQLALTSGIISIDAMNNFNNTPIVMHDYIDVSADNSSLILVVNASIENPTIFRTQIDGDIMMDALYGAEKGRLGSMIMTNMTMLPKSQGPSYIVARFNYTKGTDKADVDAFYNVIKAYMGTPKGFQPVGILPLTVGSGPPRDGFPAKNPLLRKAISGDFFLNTTLNPKPFIPLHEVNVTIPNIFQIFEKGVKVDFRVENPMPASIRVNSVFLNLTYLNLSGPHLYTFNHTFGPDEEQIISPNGLTDMHMSASLSGIDVKTVMRLIWPLVTSGKTSVPCGVVGNFSVTILPGFNLSLPGFNLSLPYTNLAIESNVKLR